VSADAVRAGRTRRAGAAAECGDAGLMALDRAAIEEAPSQHAGDRARQQACPHRLGGSRARSFLSAEDRRRSRMIKAPFFAQTKKKPSNRSQYLSRRGLRDGMKRWTNGLPGATKRLGAMMALQGLSLSQPRMRADTHDGPEQIAPLQRSDTLMQLSRSLSWKSILYRTAGPYILAQIRN